MPGRPTPLWVSSHTIKIHSVHADSSSFLGGTSLCFTDQETRKENVLGGPTPLWVSTHTSYLLYKAHDPFSPYGQSHGQNIIFFNFFLRGTSLCFTDQETQEKHLLGGPTPLWVNLVLTPAICCTKLKIHKSHADSQWPKNIYF